MQVTYNNLMRSQQVTIDELEQNGIRWNFFSDQIAMLQSQLSDLVSDLTDNLARKPYERFLTKIESDVIQLNREFHNLHGEFFKSLEPKRVENMKDFEKERETLATRLSDLLFHHAFQRGSVPWDPKNQEIWDDILRLDQLIDDAIDDLESESEVRTEFEKRKIERQRSRTSLSDRVSKIAQQNFNRNP